MGKLPKIEKRQLDRLERAVAKFYDMVLGSPIGCGQHYTMKVKDLCEIDRIRKEQGIQGPWLV